LFGLAALPARGFEKISQLSSGFEESKAATFAAVSIVDNPELRAVSGAAIAYES
jgi:hypothetical protein